MNPFIGQIMLFAGNFAPRGWAFCEGQLLQINQYSALFSILGTTYGGDGRTTFALPDLKGRMAISQGNGPGIPSYNLGQKSGNVQTVLTTANLPAAQISLPSTSATGNSPEAGGNVMATTEDDSLIYATSAATGSLASGSIQGANSTPFSNQSPYLGLYYIIALQGTFPSRS